MELGPPSADPPAYASMTSWTPETDTTPSTQTPRNTITYAPMPRWVTPSTQTAQVERCLRAHGRPATKEQLADLCGLDAARVGSLLSRIEGVVRADKHRWGFADWIDDEYEGIPAEIMQRIHEDGGSTRLSRLLDELPRLFGVTELSVRSTLSSPTFRVEHGWVSAVEDPDLGLGTLEDIASGRDARGDPYWVFTMYGRYLRGFSITGVPPELAVALGCDFGQKSTIPVQEPHGVPDISVIWRKTSPTGPEIGRVSQSLRAIRATDGDPIAMIVHTNTTVSLSHVSDLYHVDQGSNSKRSHADDSSPSRPSQDSPDSGMGVRVMKPIPGRIRTSPPEALHDGLRSHHQRNDR